MGLGTSEGHRDSGLASGSGTCKELQHRSKRRAGALDREMSPYIISREMPTAARSERTVTAARRDRRHISNLVWSKSERSVGRRARSGHARMAARPRCLPTLSFAKSRAYCVGQEQPLVPPHRLWSGGLQEVKLAVFLID
jgi:hypothetical protein